MKVLVLLFRRVLELYPPNLAKRDNSEKVKKASAVSGLQMESAKNEAESSSRVGEWKHL